VNVLYTTAEIRGPERLPRLRGTLRSEFVGLELAVPRSGSGFRGTMRGRAFDQLRVAHFTGTPITAYRSRRMVLASPRDDYLIGLQIRGVSRAAQDGRRVTLGPGDLALLDSSRPYAIELSCTGEFEHLAFRIPRVELERRCSLDGATALRIAASSAAGRLVSPYLQTLASPGWRGTRAVTDGFLETGLDLLARSLMTVSAAWNERPSTGDLQRVKARASESLGDPELSPATVARASYISVRQLHRLFAQEGVSFGSWVRDERLRRCRADLADPNMRESSIGAIAGRWGFRSPAHFTRSFSSRYGLTPSELRRRTPAAPD
jgi:AraC-like DNA-binding protein